MYKLFALTLCLSCTLNAAIIETANETILKFSDAKVVDYLADAISTRDTNNHLVLADLDKAFSLDCTLAPEPNKNCTVIIAKEDKGPNTEVSYNDDEAMALISNPKEADSFFKLFNSDPINSGNFSVKILAMAPNEFTFSCILKLASRNNDFCSFRIVKPTH
jgi:hypothetical protein